MKAKRIITSISLLLILLSVCCYFAIKIPVKKPIITHDIANHNFLKQKPSVLTEKPISDCKYLCANALRPLKIRDYTGYNQPMHPKVLYFDNPWNGWKYWMSYTPYPKGDAVFENPSIAVSNDGINWSNPPGIRNPVIKQPKDAKRGGHNSDPHLVFADNKLQLWYRYNPAKFKHNGPDYHINQIFMTYTSDGIHWSQPKMMFNDKYSYLSPVILYDDGVYKVWFSDNDGKLHYKQSSDLISWSVVQTVNLKLPGYCIWHQDIIKNNGQYETVFSAYKESKDNQNLYFAESSDGINFSKPDLILKPSERNSALDNRMILPQISKEFDLLRISRNIVVDIEMKTEATEEKIRRQLEKNKYYLSYLDKTMLLFAYEATTGKIYTLDQNGNLQIVGITTLVNALNLQSELFEGDLDELFNPSNYLVSPFNSTQKFIDDKYFLTGQQELIEKEMVSIFNKTSHCVVSIEGKPGTGKTLLLYHFAKKHMGCGKRILIIHTGNLNEGQNLLKSDFGWQIFPVKLTRNLLENGVDIYGNCKYDCIIVDEAQRINIDQLNIIFQFSSTYCIKCIVGFDRSQVLSGKEKYSSAVSVIESYRTKGFTLTEKIRTNKEIAQFIKAMFDLKKKTSAKIRNVSVIHFLDYPTARKYIETKTGFRFITFTPSQYYRNNVDQLQWSEACKGTAHQVIGQEFDNVIAIVDDVFFYDGNNELQCLNRGGNPYDQSKMLFQVVTRVRRKLEIVVINNPLVFKELLGLLIG